MLLVNSEHKVCTSVLYVCGVCWRACISEGVSEV